MKIYYTPRTKYGEWSVALLLICCVLMIMGWFVTRIQGAANPGPNNNPLLSFFMLGAVIASALGAVAGIVSIVKDHDYSTSVMASILVGLFLTYLAVELVLSGIF